MIYSVPLRLFRGTLCKLQPTQASPGDLVKMQILIKSGEGDPRVYSSNKLPGDADAAELWISHLAARTQTTNSQAAVGIT